MCDTQVPSRGSSHKTMIFSRTPWLQSPFSEELPVSLRRLFIMYLSLAVRRWTRRQQHYLPGGLLWMLALLVVMGTHAVPAAAQENRIGGQIVSPGGPPFTETLQDMLWHDDLIRREIIAGLRPMRGLVSAPPEW